MSTESDPVEPRPFGCALGSGLNAGGLQPADVTHARATLKTPVPPYALEIQTYGARPAKMPTPPRTCWVPPATGCQLNPKRGERTVVLCGFEAVLKPIVLCTVGLNDGVSGNDGRSARTPNVRVMLLFMCH